MSIPMWASHMHTVYNPICVYAAHGPNVNYMHITTIMATLLLWLLNIIQQLISTKQVVRVYFKGMATL